MSGVTCRNRHDPSSGGVEGTMSTQAQLTRLHEEYIWRVNDAVGSDVSNDELSRLLDEYADAALRLLLDDSAAAA